MQIVSVVGEVSGESREYFAKIEEESDGKLRLEVQGSYGFIKKEEIEDLQLLVLAVDNIHSMDDEVAKDLAKKLQSSWNEGKQVALGFDEGTTTSKIAPTSPMSLFGVNGVEIPPKEYPKSYEVVSCLVSFTNDKVSMEITTVKGTTFTALLDKDFTAGWNNPTIAAATRTLWENFDTIDWVEKTSDLIKEPIPPVVALYEIVTPELARPVVNAIQKGLVHVLELGAGLILLSQEEMNLSIADQKVITRAARFAQSDGEITVELESGPMIVNLQTRHQLL